MSYGAARAVLLVLVVPVCWVDRPTMWAFRLLVGSHRSMSMFALAVLVVPVFVGTCCTCLVDQFVAKVVVIVVAIAVAVAVAIAVAIVVADAGAEAVADVVADAPS